MNTAKFEALAVRYMADLIGDFDLEPFQAAGIVGNGGTESGGFTDVTENNPTSGRGGLGHFQWTGPRRRDFEAWLERNADKGWLPDTYEANYSMLFRELVGPEAAVIPAVKRATTLEGAAEAFMNKFERPGVPHLDNRITWAKKALAAFVAAGSPARPTAPKQPQEILLPLGKQPDLQALLTLLGPLLVPLLQQLASGQPLQLQLPPPVAEPPKPPEPVVVVAPTPAPAKSDNSLSMLFSILLGAGTAAGMTTGALGTPGGLGEAPTTAGSLMTIASIASPLLSYFGGYGKIASIGLNLLSGLAMRLPKK